MGKFYYQFFLGVYNIGIRITAWWNPKAKKWVLGRKDIFSKLSAIDNNNNKQTVWMHCASVGEFEQGRPVLEKLKAENEKLKVVLTFFSPSGYEACKNYTIADNIFYLPMDSSVNAVRFLDIVKPSLVLWVKYEYWFYYLNEIKKRNIPLLLVSGVFRDDQPFFKWYGLFWKKMLYCFSHLFVQNDTSKNSLSEIGFEKNVTVSGDTRFDRVEAIANKFEPLPVIENFIGNNKVIVAGSTWEEDEELFIHFVNTHPQIKLILAPHEIDAENIKNIKKAFPQAILYSQLLTANGQLSTTNCLIVDNIGMLSRLYKYANVTYIGGGFGSDGVHNVLEAAVYGKPVLFGPVYEKYTEAIDLVESGGAKSIKDALQLEKILKELLTENSENLKMSAASKKYVAENVGATKKIVNFIYENRLLIN